MVNIYKLQGFDFSVGRLRPCTFVFEDNLELSAQHLLFTNKNGCFELHVLGKNGAYLNDRFLTAKEKAVLSFSDEIKIPGITVLWLEKYVVIGTNAGAVATSLCALTEENAEIEAEDAFKNAESGEFGIAPRNYFGFEEEAVELDNPPEKKVFEDQSVFVTIGPAFSMALPMLIGFMVTAFAQKSAGTSTSAFMYTGLITAVSSAFIGVFWGYMNIKNRKGQLIAEEKKRTALYTEYVKNAEDTIRDKYIKKVGNMRLMYKSAREMMIGGGDKYLIWNKTEKDDDYLFVRLGLGNIPFDIKINVPKDRFSLNYDELKELPKRLKNKYSVLNDVPVGTDLRKNGITGILADDVQAGMELLMIIISQLAVCISPYSLKIACIFEDFNAYNGLFEAVRMLPQFRADNLILFMNKNLGNAEINKTIADVIELADRGKDDRNGGRSNDVNGSNGGNSNGAGGEIPAFVIITDDYSLVSQTVRDYKKAYVIIMSGSYERFPPGVKVIIQREQNFSGIIDFSEGKVKRQNIYFDNVSTRELCGYSSNLMSLYKHSPISKSKLPEKISFYELYGLNINDSYISSQWENNRAYENIKAYIGIDDDGVTVLDMHEKSMGPHGLIAGTTGSGKSEILQTIILSLAVNYSPLDIGIFLIDYKGGGMSNLFGNLPHLSGSISNLSGRMITRAMVSIRSENERRQKLFLKAGVNNISDYQRSFYRGDVKKPLPHIFIIIDEFAELKREEPAFMGELISVARVGRSLGVHLILATQKPSGTVDDNIWSNSKFKIALRVQDKMDSNEMLKKPDAAYLINPGRAYLQVGNDEIYKLFQGAYTMDKLRCGGSGNKVFVLDDAGRKVENENEVKICEVPQLTETVESICRAWERICDGNCSRNYDEIEDRNYSRIRDKVTNDDNDEAYYVNQLWLKPLGNRLIYEEGDEKGEHDICIGIYDDPAHQKQDYLHINIINAGNHVILGALTSGKSTLLTTISYALIKNENPKTCNLYFMDFSAGLLAPFKESHLTGGYVCSDNEEDLIKLLIMLTEIIDERKGILKGESFRQHILRKSDMPAVYLMIDGLGNLRERCEGRYDKELLYILKNGEAVGVYVIASAVSISTMELPQRFFENFKAAIALKLSDKYAYKEALRLPGDVSVLPEDIPGRGVIRLSDTCVEFQSFLPVDAEDDYERMNTLSEEVNKLADECNDKGFVRKMPTIPKHPTLSNFINYINISSGNSNSDCSDLKDIDIGSTESEIMKYKDIESALPVGYEELSGKVFYMPTDIPIFVSGRKGSGKKNFVKVCEYMAAKLGKKLDISVYDEAFPFDKLLSIKNEAGDNPYVIHFGGALDRQNFADFSYIPYSQQTKMKNVGCATVRKVSEEIWHGDIIIPLFDCQDDI